jgi:hypothetical protein
MELEDPPPPRCPEHLDNPTGKPCGACGDARRARALWEALNRAEKADEEDA